MLMAGRLPPNLSHGTHRSRNSLSSLSLSPLSPSSLSFLLVFFPESSGSFRMFCHQGPRSAACMQCIALCACLSTSPAAYMCILHYYTLEEKKEFPGACREREREREGGREREREQKVSASQFGRGISLSPCKAQQAAAMMMRPPPRCCCLRRASPAEKRSRKRGKLCPLTLELQKPPAPRAASLVHTERERPSTRRRRRRNLLSNACLFASPLSTDPDKKIAVSSPLSSDRQTACVCLSTPNFLLYEHITSPVLLLFSLLSLLHVMTSGTHFGGGGGCIFPLVPWPRQLPPQKKLIIRVQGGQLHVLVLSWEDVVIMALEMSTLPVNPVKVIVPHPV